MTLRAWLVLVGIVVMAGLNVVLISREHVETVMVEENDVEYDDRLGDLVYSKGNREKNLEAFGLDAEQIKESKTYFRRYEQMTSQIQARLKKTEDLNLADVFCARTDEIRPRYAALAVLILEENGERIIWDPKAQNSFELQGWAATYSLETIYEDIEKGREELPASTAMVVAAFVSKQESALIERQEPWGRSGRSWNWKTVQTQSTKQMKQVVEYLSILHFVTEIANEDEGICK